MALAQRRANAYAVGGNGGKDAPVNWEDRCARLQEENRQLKKARNEQDQLMTDLNTRFRKLMRDYKALSGVAPPQVDRPASGGQSASGSGSSRVTSSKLAAVERERDTLQRQVQDLKRQARMSASGTGAAPASLGLHPKNNNQFRQESIDDYLARQEREAIRSGSGDAGGSRSARSVKSAKSTGSSSHGRLTSASKLLNSGGATQFMDVDNNTPEKQTQQPRSMSGSPNRAVLQQYENKINSLTNDIDMLKQQHQRDSDRIYQLDNDLRRAQANPSAPKSEMLPNAPLFPSASTGGSTLESAELQSLRHQVQVLTGQHRAAENELEMVKRERDSLEFKLRLKPSSDDYQGYRSTDADPNTLLTLQQEVSQKTSQMAVLTSRFTHSQEQVGLMKKECDRLVDEVKNSHNQLSLANKKSFDLEQEKYALELKSDRVNELEVTLKLKSDELISCEQKMLSLADRLTTCTRETEHQVRRSCNDRFTELEGMRDEADRARRAKEHDCLTLQHDLNDAKAKNKSLTEEVETYKTDLGKVRTENRELHEKASFLGAVPHDLTDDVHRAMAMVNLKRKRDDELDVGELWQGIEWSDGWEAGRMREAVSTATYDLRVAEERYTQLKDESKEKAVLLTGISEERDKLLGENIELRHRISGIQTTLTKRMLKAQSDSITAAVGGTTVAGGGAVAGRGCLSITLNHIDCDPAIAKVQEGSGAIFTPTVFFTLDGLDGYEMAMGDHFYTVNGPVTTVFVFSGLPVTVASMEKILNSHFTLQLHQSYGTECDVVAAATINGAHLLSDFHGSGVVNLQVPLVGQHSASVGAVTGTVVLSDEFVPFLLERKLVPPTTMTPEAVNANLLCLRGVSGIRVQIFKARGLKAIGNTLPQPYVFYTVLNLPSGLSSFINDTVVHPRGELVTADPNFDSATPVEHAVVMDATIMHFFLEASISFIVFDAVSGNFESNLGMASVPLKPLLESPGSTIQVSEELYPQGTLEVGISWVSAH